MEREKCEKLIFKKLKEITDIYLEYNKKGEYLSLSFIKLEDNELYFSFNNDYGRKDINKPLNFTKFEKENKKMKYKEIFFKYPMYKGYFNVVIKNKKRQVIYDGMNLLSALDQMLKYNVVDFKEKQGGYEVTLDCINAKIDIETANEFMEESGLL